MVQHNNYEYNFKSQMSNELSSYTSIEGEDREEDVDCNNYVTAA